MSNGNFCFCELKKGVRKNEIVGFQSRTEVEQWGNNSLLELMSKCQLQV